MQSRGQHLSSILQSKHMRSISKRTHDALQRKGCNPYRDRPEDLNPMAHRHPAKHVTISAVTIQNRVDARATVPTFSADQTAKLEHTSSLARPTCQSPKIIPRTALAYTAQPHIQGLPSPSSPHSTQPLSSGRRVLSYR